MKISEVSERFELSTDTLRYYERIGLIPRVNRNQSGIRDYTEQDCRWIQFVKCMRSAGLPIEALVKYVALFQQGDATVEARIEILAEQRDELMARIRNMQETLVRLNYKIERYDQILIPVEKELTEAKAEVHALT